MKKIAAAFITALSLSLTSNYANACTDFQITAKDKTLLITRSMEFAPLLNSNIRSSNRGREFTVATPGGQAGRTWKATYGYIFADGMNQDIAIDGMNEKGLAFEYLYLPGETVYQTIPAGKENLAIPYYLFGDWVLGNFKTVEEVKAALSDVYIFQQTLPNLGDAIFPLHAAIHDASGKGIVIEFVNGQMQIHDFIGVMTNSPTYEWQVDNLRNYLNLTPYNPTPITANGLTFSATGQGAGMVGLPGDISPPSRFVKMAFMLNNVYPASNVNDALNIAQHIINNVDIALGTVRAKDPNGKDSAELTQWVVFKDLTHKMFYYRTYNDMSLRVIVMEKVDFSDTAKRLKMPMSEAPYVMDVTSRLLNSI